MESSLIRYTIYITFISVGLSFVSCKKYLNEPSDKKLVVPSTLKDLQALIDRGDKSTSGYSDAGEESSDDYFLTSEDYNALNYDYDQRRYLWGNSDVFPPAASVNSWNGTYSAIFASNSVLEFLPDIPNSNSQEGRYIKGQALLWRAFHYFDAAQIWTLPYDENTSAKDLGLPLRLSSDFNIPSVRSSVKETYAQIISDLKEAIPLLPTSVINAVRASKQGAFGVLARTYMTMRDYNQATLYADSCLQIANDLMDFNTLIATENYPIKRLNKEVVLYTLGSTTLARNNIAKINPEVYQMYNDADLRKQVFFAINTGGSYKFKGSYIGNVSFTNCIATDEMYLIRAEGFARQGKIAEAIQDLNTLLVNRWDKTKEFVPYTANTSLEALGLVLQERRKELIMRGLRWMDIRRLNKEGYNIIQKRVINGETHTLNPNDLRYAIALPEDIIQLSKMPQNPR